MKIVNFILKLLLFVLKVVVSFFIKMFLLFVLIGALIGTVSSKKIKNDFSVPDNSYVEIDLSQKLSERKTNIPKLFNEREIGFYSLLTALEKIKSDKKVKGIILKLDNLSANYAQIEELSTKLDELKLSGKNMYSYATTMNNRIYSLASKSNTVMMPEAASTNVDMTGYYTELGYYKNFVDKLGIDFNVIHVGDFKSYGENYTKSEMSPEYRSNLTALYDKIFDRFTNKVAKERKINKNFFESILLRGELMASNSKKMEEYGLIDKFGYYEDLKNIIGANKIISINKYSLAQNMMPKLLKGDRIGLICAEGEILNSNVRGSSSIGYITPDSLIKDLDKALNNNDIKGIVLRINSPGGSALASDIISNKIKAVNEVKPVYISIGGMAASGGYYISSPASKIYASNDSITGSIGVVALIPNFSRLITEKGKINMEKIQKGDFADLYSVSTSFDESKKEKLYSSCADIYDNFLSVVSEGRNIPKADLDKIAQGRVWLGADGKQNGLVDEIGGLDKCIRDLARNIGLSSYSVEEVTTVMTFDSLLDDYVPFSKVVTKLNSFITQKDSYFRGTLYFPYGL